MNEQELLFLYDTLGGSYKEGAYSFTKASLTGSSSDGTAPDPVAVAVAIGYVEAVALANTATVFFFLPRCLLACLLSLFVAVAIIAFYCRCRCCCCRCRCHCRCHLVVFRVRFVMRTVPSLSRVHFHSLQHHIVAQTPGSPFWTSSVSSVSAGSSVATLRACDVAGEASLHGNDLEVKAGLTFSTADPYTAAPSTPVSVTNKQPTVTWTWAVPDYTT